MTLDLYGCEGFVFGVVEEGATLAGVEDQPLGYVRPREFFEFLVQRPAGLLWRTEGCGHPADVFGEVRCLVLTETRTSSLHQLLAKRAGVDIALFGWDRWQR